MNNVPTSIREDLLAEEFLQRFMAMLRGYKTRHVQLSDLWAIYRKIYGEHATVVEARYELNCILSRLQADGYFKLPSESGRCWERTSVVPLPNWVKLRGAPSSDPRRWRDFPWHPSLQWVPQLSILPLEQEAFLMQVQRGFVEGKFAQHAPLKYRALQLTGNEKQLELLLESQLFAKGRLTLELLNCDGPWLPLTWERVAKDPVMVLFENAGSFLVAARVLSSLTSPPVGIVAYGGGFQVLKAVPYLGRMKDLRQIRYVGDLDAKGIEIGAAFTRLVSRQGTVSVVPATEIHQMMLRAAAELGSPNGWPCQTCEILPSCDGWLSESIATQVMNFVSANRRIPEEVLHDGHFKELWRSHVSST